MLHLFIIFKPNLSQFILMQSLPVVQFTYKGCNKAQFYLEMIMKLFLEGLQYITVCYISFYIVLFDYLYYLTIILNTTIIYIYI